ncbi:MAG: PepSY-associated TM helix domain-containing protein, partial [Candidatus Rokuibacteriota bacterium]
SESFQPAGGSNPDGQGFEPVKDRGYDVGVKVDLFKGRLVGTLSLYQITKQNALNPDPTRTNFQIQSGEERSRGIEVEVAGTIRPGWDVIGAYALTDAGITEDTNITRVGREKPNVPEHAASLWTRYTFQEGLLKGLSRGGGVFYVGERPGDLLDSYRLPEYVRFDALLGYRFRQFQAALNFQNLTNTTHYVSGGSRTSIFPGPPFSVVGSIAVAYWGVPACVRPSNLSRPRGRHGRATTVYFRPARARRVPRVAAPRPRLDRAVGCVTGILLNHRGDIMKIPWAKAEQTTVQLPLPRPQPVSPEAMAAWLRTELGIEKPWRQARAQPSRTVVWGGREVRQPERWTVTFPAPQRFVAAEYWVGNSFVTVRRSDPNVWAFLNNLHQAGGMGAGWILLADTVAGSFILLSLTGVMLWTRLHGPRLLAAVLGLGSLLLGVWFTYQSM